LLFELVDTYSLLNGHLNRRFEPLRSVLLTALFGDYLLLSFFFDAILAALLDDGEIGGAI
jgi:hypothetical protein